MQRVVHCIVPWCGVAFCNRHRHRHRYGTMMDGAGDLILVGEGSRSEMGWQQDVNVQCVMCRVAADGGIGTSGCCVRRDEVRVFLLLLFTCNGREWVGKALVSDKMRKSGCVWAGSFSR